MTDAQTPIPQMIFLPTKPKPPGCNCTACLLAYTDKLRAFAAREDDRPMLQLWAALTGVQKPAQKPVEPSWSDAEVCTDCYMAHHFGWHEHEGQWFSGESDEPCDREPLNLLSRHTLADNVNSETEEGLISFSWRACEGCGSNLGGSRFSLRVFS